jgi:hypothetical protein
MSGIRKNGPVWEGIVMLRSAVESSDVIVTPLRRYATLVRIISEAPTRALSNVALASALFQEMPDDQWYGVHDTGVISGGTIVGEPEDIGESDTYDADEVATLFPSLCRWKGVTLALAAD